MVTEPTDNQSTVESVDLWLVTTFHFYTNILVTETTLLALIAAS